MIILCIRFVQGWIFWGGGALLDENGSVIGIAVSGIERGGPLGLNFFIPIGDAMDFLNLEQK